MSVDVVGDSRPRMLAPHVASRPNAIQHVGTVEEGSLCTFHSLTVVQQGKWSRPLMYSTPAKSTMNAGTMALRKWYALAISSVRRTAIHSSRVVDIA